MAACVLDSSAALSWFLPGEQTARTEALLDQVTEVGALVPSLWPVEMGNVLLRGRTASPRRSGCWR